MSASEYQPSDDMAADRSEGGIVDLTEDDWPAQGVWPEKPVDATYTDDFEPLAETDNAWNTQQREDDKRLNKAAGDLKKRVDALESELDDLEAAFLAHNHDDRYYLKTQTYSTGQADDRFVNETGDTMTGPLDMEAPINMAPQSPGANTSRAIRFNNDTYSDTLTIETQGSDYVFRNVSDQTVYFYADGENGGVRIDGPEASIKLSSTTAGGSFSNGTIYVAADGHAYLKRGGDPVPLSK